SEAGESDVGVALVSWRATRCTRRTGERAHGPRLIYTNRELVRMDAPGRTWSFPQPFGEQGVASVPLAETITISRHLRTREVRAYLNETSLNDVRATKAPRRESRTASQTVVMDVRVAKGHD